jgi:hypothetical protein
LIPEHQGEICFADRGDVLKVIQKEDRAIQSGGPQEMIPGLLQRMP